MPITAAIASSDIPHATNNITSSRCDLVGLNRLPRISEKSGDLLDTITFATREKDVHAVPLPSRSSSTKGSRAGDVFTSKHPVSTRKAVMLPFPTLYNLVA